MRFKRSHRELVLINNGAKVMSAQGKTELFKGFGNTDTLVMKTTIKLETVGEAWKRGSSQNFRVNNWNRLGSWEMFSNLIHKFNIL